jgi:hypothetical protein
MLGEQVVGLEAYTERGFLGFVRAGGELLDDVAVNVGERLGHSKYLCRGLPVTAYRRGLALIPSPVCAPLTAPSVRQRTQWL